MCRVEIRGSHRQTHTHPCMQSKQNLKQNPRVNSEHHCAKCNNPSAEWISPCGAPPLRPSGEKVPIFALCALASEAPDPSPLYRHSSSPPWRRSRSSCSPWRSVASRHKMQMKASGAVSAWRIFKSERLTMSSLSSHSTSDRSTLL